MATLSVPPMLPEDRKHLDVPSMPAPGMRFRKDGLQWELVGVHTEISPLRHPRLTLEFAVVNPV